MKNYYENKEHLIPFEGISNLFKDGKLVYVYVRGVLSTTIQGREDTQQFLIEYKHWLDTRDRTWISNDAGIPVRVLEQ